MAKRATRAQWLERVRSWKSSGKTCSAFAAKEDVSEHSLRWWAWKLRSDGEDIEAKPKAARRPRRKKRKPLELVELVADSSASPSPMTMRVGPVEVQVERGFDRELLGSVLDVLEARR